MNDFDPTKPSTGFGDSIAKVTNFLGIDRLADAVAKLAGAEDCGCKERREYLNELFPYEETTRQVRFLKDAIIEGVQYRVGNTVLVKKGTSLHPRLLLLAKDGILEEV
jgi:hypothetical protein